MIMPKICNTPTLGTLYHRNLYTDGVMVITQRDPVFQNTRTPKVCKILAFMAAIIGLGLLLYMLLGLR